MSKLKQSVTKSWIFFSPWLPCLENSVILTCFLETFEMLGFCVMVYCPQVPLRPCNKWEWNTTVLVECVYGEFGGWGWTSALMLEVVCFWLPTAMTPKTKNSSLIKPACILSTVKSTVWWWRSVLSGEDTVLGTWWGLRGERRRHVIKVDKE